MARPLRIEFPGAVYHVTSRGDRREPIVLGDEDCEDLLGVLQTTNQWGQVLPFAPTSHKLLCNPTQRSFRIWRDPCASSSQALCIT